MLGLRLMKTALDGGGYFFVWEHQSGDNTYSEWTGSLYLAESLLRFIGNSNLYRLGKSIFISLSNYIEICLSHGTLAHERNRKVRQ